MENIKIPMFDSLMKRETIIKKSAESLQNKVFYQFLSMEEKVTSKAS